MIDGFSLLDTTILSYYHAAIYNTSLVPFSTVVAHKRDCGFLLYAYFELIEG